jgi:hypothetical protein
MIQKINKHSEQNIDTEHFRDHRHDCEKLKNILLEKGYSSSVYDCYNLWSDYSDGYAAGWMLLPDEDEEIWNAIKYNVEEMINKNVE